MPSLLTMFYCLRVSMSCENTIICPLIDLFEGRLGWRSSWQKGSCKDGGTEGREDEVAGGDRAQLQALGPSGGSDPF